MYNRNVQKMWSRLPVQPVPEVVMKDKDLAVASRTNVSQLNGNKLLSRT